MVNLPGATLTMRSGGVNLSPFINQGTFIKDSSGNLQFSNLAVTNSGLLSVRGGVLVFSSGLVQTSTGELQLAGGNVTLREHNSGILSGAGTNLSSLFINNAILRPGAPLGVYRTTTFSGRFEQTTNGVLEIEIGGLQAGSEHDQVFSEGALYLVGTLRLSLRNNFLPELGQGFTILLGTRINSAAPRFTTVEGADLGGGKRFEACMRYRGQVACRGFAVGW